MTKIPDNMKTKCPTCGRGICFSLGLNPMTHVCFNGHRFKD